MRTPAQIERGLEVLKRRLDEAKRNDPHCADLLAKNVEEIFGRESQQMHDTSFGRAYPGSLERAITGFIRMLEEESEVARYERGAAICESGHLVLSGFDSPFDDGPVPIPPNYCPKCGAGVATSCGNCRSVIPATDAPPKFCAGCGKPYVWTGHALTAAQELAEEMEGLTDRQRAELAKSVDELMRDTPYGEIAALRFKKLIAAAKGPSAKVLSDIVFKFASQAIKTHLGVP